MVRNNKILQKNKSRLIKSNYVIIPNKIIHEIRWALLKWFTVNQRIFPWRRKNATAYEIFISEFFLQRTKAERVVPVYYIFLKRYRNIFQLAHANIIDVSTIIKPIGFQNRRARDLILCSKRIVKEYNGIIPSDPSILLDLPGVGPYITNAFLGVSYKRVLPIIDVNVNRIYTRLFQNTIASSNNKEEQLWSIASQLLPTNKSYNYNWALLDLSAIVCKSSKPNHQICPLKRYCECVMQK